MTLDDAIEHAEERACGNDRCAKDHAQLADWLRELRRARMKIDLLKTLRDGFKADAQKYGDENARLRSCLSDDAENARQILGENAKLRKYAKAYLASVRFSCEPCPYCAPDSCEPETLPLRDGCRLYEEMRELGIEVGE